MLNDPADARRVLVEAPLLYERPPPFRRPLRPVAGDGVLLAEGMAWRHKRLRLAPVFSPARIARLLPHFQLASDDRVRSLKGRAVDLGSPTRWRSGRRLWILRAGARLGSEIKVRASREPALLPKTYPRTVIRTWGFLTY